MAKAVVKAHEMHGLKKQEEERKKSRFTAGFISWLVAAFFFLLSIACLIVAFVFIATAVQWCAKYSASMNLPEIAMNILGYSIFYF